MLMGGLGIVGTPLMRKGRVKVWLNPSGYRCSFTHAVLLYEDRGPPLAIQPHVE